MSSNKIAEFRNITGCDEDIAQIYLMESNDNLEQAVNTFFQSAVDDSRKSVSSTAPEVKKAKMMSSKGAKPNDYN